MSELDLSKGQNKGHSGRCSLRRSARCERSGRDTSHRNLFLICWEPVGRLGDESKTSTRRSNFQWERSPWSPVESRLEGSKEGSRVAVRWSRQRGWRRVLRRSPAGMGEVMHSACAQEAQPAGLAGG